MNFLEVIFFLNSSHEYFTKLGTGRLLGQDETARAYIPITSCNKNSLIRNLRFPNQENVIEIGERTIQLHNIINKKKHCNQYFI